MKSIKYFVLIIIFQFLITSFAYSKDIDIIIFSTNKNSSIARQIKNKIKNKPGFRIHYINKKYSNEFSHSIEKRIDQIQNQIFEFQENRAIRALDQLISKWNPSDESISEQKILIRLYELLLYSHSLKNNKKNMDKVVVKILKKYPFYNLNSDIYPPSLIKYYEKKRNHFLFKNDFLSFHLNTIPEGGNVYFNGFFLGKSPLKYNFVLPGQHLILGKNKNRVGYKKIDTTIKNLNSNISVKLNRNLKKTINRSFFLDQLNLENKKLVLKLDKAVSIVPRSSFVRIFSSGFKLEVDHIINLKKIKKNEDWIENIIVKKINALHSSLTPNLSQPSKE